jgi:hypothetical protein
MERGDISSGVVNWAHDNDESLGSITAGLYNYPFYEDFNTMDSGTRFLGI